MLYEDPKAEKINKRLPNIFTVDVEDWYHATDLRIHQNDRPFCESRIQESTGKILDLLAESNVKALFFVLTDIALKHPGLVKRIQRDGHEIGSHGCMHRLLSDMTQDEFRQDLQKSRYVLEDITGEQLKYYRAPAWSVSRKNYRVFEMLEQEGIVCSSSTQPFKTPLSGDRQTPLEPFHPVINGKALSLVEFPSTVRTCCCFRIPFAGGLFLRMMPEGIIRKSLYEVNRERPGMVYVHPWEMDLGQPRKLKPFYIAITHYGNLNTTGPKLKMILEHFQFITMKEFLETRSFPEKPIGKL